MTHLKVAAFGEAEKGKFSFPYILHNLAELNDHLGNPPEESLGISYAVQTLLYERELIFFRVEEEGFSLQMYLTSLQFLKDLQAIGHIDALCMPGVGDPNIIEATDYFSQVHRSILIITEQDLYDYLTAQKS